MGNCQAMEGGGVLVEQPSGKVEKLGGPCISITAHHLMAKFPGYFVAIANPAPATSSSASSSVSSFELVLLPSGAPLRTGNCYRLVSFEDAFKHFAQACAAGESSLCRSPALSTLASHNLTTIAKHQQRIRSYPRSHSHSHSHSRSRSQIRRLPFALSSSSSAPPWLVARGCLAGADNIIKPRPSYPTTTIATINRKAPPTIPHYICSS